MASPNPFLQSGPAAVRPHGVFLSHGPVAWAPPDRTSTRESALAASDMFVAPDASPSMARFPGVPVDVPVLATPRGLPVLESACWAGMDRNPAVDHGGLRM